MPTPSTADNRPQHRLTQRRRPPHRRRPLWDERRLDSGRRQEDNGEAMNPTLSRF
jgi:hypothetical protein